MHSYKRGWGHPQPLPSTPLVPFLWKWNQELLEKTAKKRKGKKGVGVGVKDQEIKCLPSRKSSLSKANPNIGRSHIFAKHA